MVCLLAIASVAQPADIVLPLDFADPQGCNVPFIENTIPMVFVNTTLEDCAPGFCIYTKNPGQVMLAPCRLTGSLLQVPIISKIEIDIVDYCGSGCTMGFLYDIGGLPIASSTNTVVAGPETMIIQPLVAVPCHSFAVSSCEAIILEIRIYVSPSTMILSGDITYSAAGACTGGIDLTVTNGTPPYTYAWSNQATSPNLTNLCPGTYSVTVTDDNNYTVDSFFDVFYEIEFNGTPTPASGASACDGSVLLAPTGGESPYTYLWSNGASTPDISSLCPGTYTATITDANNYQIDSFFDITYQIEIPSKTLPIEFPDPLTCLVPVIENGVEMSVIPTTGEDCAPGACNFIKDPGQIFLGPARLHGVLLGEGIIEKIEIDIIDNCGPACTRAFLYDVGGLTIANDANTATGFSTLTLIPSTPQVCGAFAVSSCQGIVLEVRIYVASQPLDLSGVVVDASSVANCNGSIDVSVTGGTTPYTYAWSNQATSQDLSQLCPGTYTVSVTDATGFVVDSFFDVFYEIDLNEVVTHTTGVSNCDGVIALNPQGGVPPYTYLWSNGMVTSTIAGLCVGPYTVTVTDGANFSVDSFFDITYQIELPGACCLPNGTCISETATNCNTAGGTFHGSSVSCSSVNCWSTTNAFSLTVDQQGIPIAGGGTGNYDDPFQNPSDFNGWYYYPNTNWWNIWFYDHPYDPTK